jgi:uncharacterized membrane protein YhaH (DUF805 family)
MFVDLNGPHILVVLIMLIADIAALVQVWRDRSRSNAVKIVWTVVVIALPVIGLIGWAVNWLLGRAADHSGHSSVR